MERYDLVVIGSGPAGEKAAAQAAYFGKRVAIVEKAREPGGAAVHTGTLPSKTLRESAIYLSGHRSRALYGVAVTLEADATVQTLMARKRAIAIAESRRIRDNLSRHSIDYVEGHARFVSEHEIEVRDTKIYGEHFLIATGSKPRRPSDVDFDSPRVHDSDEILGIEALPKSMIVLGAGVIGCEYACMFAALGTKVLLVDARPDILPFIDTEIRDRLQQEMGALGIDMHQPHRWGAVVDEGPQVSVQLDDGNKLGAEHLLFAAGRTGNTGDLGLETIGIEPNARGYLDVDDAYRTSIPHVLAAGDVIGFPALASASMEQGRVAVCRAFEFSYKQSMSEMIPYGIYTIPEVSAVGRTEQECVEGEVPHVVGRARFRDNARGQIQGDLGGLLKLVACAETRKLLGVHVVGERASEMVHLGQAALLMGATVDLFIEMVFNFPTLSETYKYAAYECLGALARRGA